MDQEHILAKFKAYIRDGYYGSLIDGYADEFVNDFMFREQICGEENYNYLIDKIKNHEI